MKVTRQTFDEVMMPCYVPQNMVLTHGKGCFLYDSEGNEYLDMTAGIAVNCLGHNHPVVVKTIKKQAERLIHVSNIFVNDKTLTLAKKLVNLTGYERVFFVNSGAEANEAALKLARRVAFDDFGVLKDEIISFDHSFHGRTLFSVSVGGQAKYSQGFGPTPGGITHLPFNDLEAFKKTISDKTCAVILEVVQGEGGILEVDPVFLKEVRALCTKHNALLIFDEVQTGIGRLGTFYGYEQVGVKPDIVTSAKGLAAGVPIGAILTSDRIGQHFKPGTHGSTFGGNPLACAVGSKVVDIISDQTFLDKVRANGEFLREQLRKLNKKYGIFADIRGKGLLVGAQLAAPYNKELSSFQKLCTKHKLLVLSAGYDVVRFAPPLIITKSEIRKALAAPYNKELSSFQKLCTKHKLLVLSAGYDVVRFAPPLIITKSEIRKAMKLLEAVITDFLSSHKLNQITQSQSPASEDKSACTCQCNCQDKASQASDSLSQSPKAEQPSDTCGCQEQAASSDDDLVDEEGLALAQEVISSFDSLESLADALLPQQDAQKANQAPEQQVVKVTLSEQAMNDYMEQLLKNDDAAQPASQDQQAQQGQQGTLDLAGAQSQEWVEGKKSVSSKAKKTKAKRR